MTPTQCTAQRYALIALLTLVAGSPSLSTALTTPNGPSAGWVEDDGEFWDQLDSHLDQIHPLMVIVYARTGVLTTNAGRVEQFIADYQNGGIRQDLLPLDVLVGKSDIQSTLLLLDLSPGAMDPELESKLRATLHDIDRDLGLL